MSDVLAEMPSWLSVIPPLVAILAALLFREVITALLLSVLSGGIIYGYYSNGFVGVLEGLLSPIDKILVSIAPPDGDTGHISVIVFSLFIGGMVAVITANGSMNSLVNRMARKATSQKRGMFVTWLMGLVIFFDDFANTMIVGNTMRPLTDKLKISREKLAYIVDSTAAPIAAIALVTTWIGAELQFIDDGISGLVDFPAGRSAYMVFLSSLEYMFYPILTLIFILILIFTGKDFGPMRKAKWQEPIFTTKEKELPHGPIWKGLLPIAIMLFGTIGGLYMTGIQDLEVEQGQGLMSRLTAIIGNADSYKAILWASFSSIIVAILISLGQLGLETTVRSAISGFKKMLPALMILVLAWSLALVTKEMGTADYISSVLLGHTSPTFVPFLTFVTAAIISFATGSSWGTMAILYPVVIASSWEIGVLEGLSVMDNYAILANVVASVLAGSVLGDHCSPISDTTVLSSLATDCDHLSHVRTQLPYAMTVGLVSLVFGTLLSAFGLPFWLCMILCVALLFGIVSYFGQRTTE